MDIARDEIVRRTSFRKSPTFSKKPPTFWEKSPTFLGKSPTFFGKRPMFLLGAWRRMNLTLEEYFIVLPVFVFFTALARARVRAP